MPSVLVSSRAWCPSARWWVPCFSRGRAGLGRQDAGTAEQHRDGHEDEAVGQGADGDPVGRHPAAQLIAEDVAGAIGEVDAASGDGYPDQGIRHKPNRLIGRCPGRVLQRDGAVRRLANRARSAAAIWASASTRSMPVRSGARWARPVQRPRQVRSKDRQASSPRAAMRATRASEADMAGSARRRAAICAAARRYGVAATRRSADRTTEVASCAALVSWGVLHASNSCLAATALVAASRRGCGTTTAAGHFASRRSAPSKRSSRSKRSAEKTWTHGSSSPRSRASRVGPHRASAASTTTAAGSSSGWAGPARSRVQRTAAAAGTVSHRRSAARKSSIMTGRAVARPVRIRPTRHAAESSPESRSPVKASPGWRPRTAEQRSRRSAGAPAAIRSPAR